MCVAFAIKFARTNQKFAENSEFCERQFFKKFTIIQNYSLVSLGASPWLLRFLSGYMEKIGARAGPCIGDLLTSHWAKNAELFIQGDGR